MLIEDLKKYLKKMEAIKIAVVGDLMLDQYIFGSATRISPEAPIPIVLTESENVVLGGAANVLRNISALNVKAYACGIIGNDPEGLKLRSMCDKSNINHNAIITLPNRRTTVKTRVIADNQQLLRVDNEDVTAISKDDSLKILNALENLIQNEGIQGIIIEDYNKGLIGKYLCDGISILSEKYNLLSALDPHPGNRFEISGLTLMTPNHQEAFAMAAIYHSSCIIPIAEDLPLKAVAEKIQTNWHTENLLITLGADGMALFDKHGNLNHIPTVAREVFDVSGAGDTVIAVCTLALLAGASPKDAAIIANHAAGVVVGHIGTVSITLEELINSFD